MRTFPKLLCTALAALLLPLAAQGQAPAGDQRLRDALRTTTQQLRTAEDDRARLQAGEAAMKKEVADLKAELEKAKKGPKGPSPRALADLNEKLAAAQKQVAEQALASRTVEDELRKCQALAQEGNRSQEEQRAEHARAKERLAAAEAKNARLYAVSREVLDWIQSMGFGEVLAAREPFLGLKRVELENAAQDYDDKVREQRVVPVRNAP
jgi:chromosome segregation ATPase